MTLIGSYILGSSGIRIYDTKIKDAKTYWVNDDKVSDPEIWTPELISDKTKTVFTEIPKLECLIIVDPGIYSNDCINAALEVAQNYSAKLKIIPALMARFCYVTSKTENPPRNLKEFLIIVTICRELCDWHILQLTSNGYDYIIDHLYEKKNFHDTVSIMAKRYSNYKTILLYSKDDEKFVSGLKLKCEKMYVPNWNQMLTEGGLQKGIWTNNSLTGRSKDVIDFASGMSLKIDNRPPLSLVKQGAKLPIKKKHSVFEDLRSFAINRDYQHVDYDKITRESCVIFQKELSCEVYKFNLNVRIEKNGQCFIDFQYQKQIFAAPTANVADNSSAQNSDEYATAESMSDKSTTSSLDNNSKALLSVEKETKSKGKAVLGYSLFSKTCKFYNSKIDKEETFKCSFSNDLTFTNTSNRKDQSPTKRVEDLLSQLPIFTIDAIVFVHDGRFPIEWLKQARDVARKHSTRIFFISEPMALKLNALRLMKTAVKENQTLALTFIYNSICVIYFLKRDSSTYSFIDEAEYPTVNLEKVRNVLLTRRSTDVAVIITDNLTKEIRETFVYKEKSILKVEFIAIDNYDIAFVDGAMAKAQKVAEGSGEYPDILQYCGQLKIIIDDELGVASMCPPYEQIPKTIKKVIYVTGAKDFKVIQYKSAFSKREFVLYSNNNIPSSWEDIEITVKLYLAGLFEVTISPMASSENIIAKQINSEHNGVQLSSSFSNASLIPSKTFEGRERLQEQLYNIDCTFIIFLKEEESTASVEVLLNGKFYQVKNPSGNVWTPAYISFKKEKLKIGEAALKDFNKKPEFVVFDMFRLLGRSSDQVNPQASWGFSIAENPRNSNSIVYEIETWEGRRAITPEFALGLYLKALKRLAETILKQPQTRVTIFIPAYYKTAHNNALKKACIFAGLSLSQTMQYPRN